MGRDGPAAGPPHLRPAVRAVVLDPDDRILLGHFDLPLISLWAPPGGGIEPGETVRQALHRELREEVGLDLPAGPLTVLWHRTVVVPGAVEGYDGQVEDYVLVRTEAFTPRGDLDDEELAAEHLDELRWWTPAELDEAEAANVKFAPRYLPALLRDLRRDGPPASPLSLDL